MVSLFVAETPLGIFAKLMIVASLMRYCTPAGYTMLKFAWQFCRI